MEAKTNFRKWIILTRFSRQKDLELEKMTRPERIGRRRTPSSLDDMTMGQMVQLSSCKEGEEVFYKACEVLMGMTCREVDRSMATEVVRFVGWTVGCIRRINALFDKVKIRPDAEEVRAGINTLNFGIFGLVDWYALRMGITDHEDVMGVSWGRVYKCLEIDNRTMQYRKELNRIYADGNNRR